MKIKKKVRNGVCIFEKGRRYVGGSDRDIIELEESEVSRFGKNLLDVDVEAEERARYERLDGFEKIIHDAVKAKKAEEERLEKEKKEKKKKRDIKRAEKGSLNRMDDGNLENTFDRDA